MYNDKVHNNIHVALTDPIMKLERYVWTREVTI